MSAGLLQRWRALAGPDSDALGDALIRARLLDETQRRTSLIRDRTFVDYAIWFHDAVYRPGEPDNEKLSADWARTALTHDPNLAEGVARDENELGETARANMRWAAEKMRRGRMVKG